MLFIDSEEKQQELINTRANKTYFSRVNSFVPNFF